MDKNKQSDEIDRALKDSELRMKSIEANIEKLDKEINALTPRKAELERNIEFHKKSGTIPLAHEYRKSKAELSKTTARLILINSDRKKAQEAVETIQQIIEKLKRDKEELFKSYDNNVLWVLFGVKRGKE